MPDPRRSAILQSKSCCEFTIFVCETKINESWSGGILEWWNIGMVEYWNGGMMERWNDGMMESCNLAIL